jgi:hypothetical protein
MAFFTITNRYIFTLAAACMLTACGGSPSEGDVQQAMTKALTADIGREKGAMTGDQTKKLDEMAKKIKLDGCADASEKVYKCDFSIEMDGKTAKDSAKFIKGQSGWEVTHK